MIGEVIGSYRIVAKLGEGGMSAVYLGEHQHIARKAAIKVLLPELSANQQIVARFFNEARATSLIRHPGIVDIIDCSVLPDGNAYIVMEYLSGESLAAHLRDHPRLPATRALFLARHIADALSAAHSQKIVHRDLKPDNVFLLGGSDATPLKILDFGIAKLMHAAPGEGHFKTRTGSLMGTPVYMSPEQCRGAGEVDHRTDIYSLGCIVFEMLCGRPPFTYEGFGELIQAHLGTVPPRARSIDATIAPAVDALVARLLAKPPAERPQTMRDVIDEIDEIGAAVAAAPAAPARSADRPVAARPIAETAPPIRERPQAQTTLRSAASERMGAVREGAGDTPVPATPSRRPVLFTVTALVAATAATSAIWMAKRPAAEAPPSAVTAAAAAAPAPPPPPSAPPPRPAPAPEPSPPAVAPPASPQIKPTAATPAPAPAAPRRVKVVIASEPSGADVCLAKDHILLGKTMFEWTTDRSVRSAKFLIRMRGYRGREIAVATDRDAKKQVTLTKLGPDDIDDTDNCERR
jgi:tRNA A-37 threonylcarbamoyl transferase component Bud32